MTRALRGLSAIVLSLVVVVIGIVVAASVGGYFYAQTEGGRRALADAVAEMLTTPHTEVRIGEIGPGLPARLAVRDLVMRDAEGAWLAVDEALLTWSPWALLERRVHVNQVSADGITLARLPPAAEEPPPDEEPGTGEVTLPSLPVDVRIDEIDVRDLRLGEPIVGEAMTLAIAGQISAPTRSAYQTDLRVERTDQPGLRASVFGTFDPGSDVLALDVDVSEPKDGLIARLAGLEPYPPVSLRLQGEGSLADWKGRLTASAGDLVDVDVTIKIARDETVRLLVSGRAGITGLVEPPVRALVEDVVSLDVAVSQVAGNAYRIDRLAVRSDAIAATGEGRIDLEAQTVDAALTVSSVDEARLQPLLGGAGVGQVDLRAEASGPLALPNVVLTGSVEAVSVPDVIAMETIKLDAHLSRADEADDDAQVLTFAADVDAAGIDAADPALAGLTGDVLRVSAQGIVNLETMVVDLAQATVLSGPTRLSASGEMNLETGDIDAALETAIGDLSALGAALGQPLQGALRLEAQAAGNVETMALTGGTLEGAVSGFSMGDPAIDDVVGDRITVAADYTVHGGERASINAVVRAGKALNLKVDGKLTDSLQTLLATYRLEADRLDVIGDAFGIPVAGALTVSGTAEGDVADPSVTATASLTDGRYQDFRIETATLDVSARNLTGSPAGRISLSAQTQAGPVDVSTEFVTPQPEHLSVRSLTAELPGLTLSGNADIALTDNTADGRLQATLEAEDGVEILGTRIEGRGQLDLRLDREDGGQRVAIELAAGPLAIASGGAEVLRARSIGLQGTIADALGTPRIQAELSAAAIGSGGMAADSVTARLEGPLSGADFRIAVDGFGEPPLDVTTAGNVGVEGEEVRAALQRLEGSYGDIPFSLRQDATIVYAPAGVTIDALAMNVASGQVSVDGTIGGASTDATISVTDMPASLAEVAAPDLELEGELGAEARLRAEGDLIAGTVRLNADSIVQQKGGVAAAPPLDATVNVTLQGGQARAQGQITGVGESPLTFSGEMPLAIDAETLSPRPRQTTPVQAQVQWRGAVQPLMQVLPLPDQRLTGRGRIDVAISGTLDAPIASGEVSIREGTYEHLVYGTLIRNLDLVADMGGGGEGARRIRLSLSGTDGGNGTIRATGQADLADLAGEPIDLALEIRNMTLVRRDDVTASASGQVTYEGTLTAGLLEGRIETEKVEVRLVDQLPPSVVSLDVIEVRDGETPEAAVEAAEEAASQDEGSIRLDLTLRLPARVFVGGRGLESEWSGTLEITGTLSNPRVVGSISTIRGTFDFAGRQFDLSESSITFDGGRKINPKLDIKARYEGDEFTAVVSVTGTPSDPQLGLSSNPALPQSEILPQVLFGKSSSQLSPGEAVEIALALDTIARGGGLSENVIGKVRRTLGLANLSIGTSDAGDPTVRAGRYIGDRVYVETVQGARPGTSKYRAEVELTDQLSLEAETGEPSENTGEYFGFKWQYDY